jgi:hypothetical protein
MTTLNIDNDIFRAISLHAESKGISKSKLIKKLIKKCMQKSRFIKSGNPVKYQESRTRDSWHVFHIRLCDCDYEFFLDLRKVLKSSVSRILAFAVEQYLGKETKDVDNYCYNSYSVVMVRKIDGIQWQLNWSISKTSRDQNDKNTDT